MPSSLPPQTHHLRSPCSLLLTSPAVPGSHHHPSGSAWQLWPHLTRAWVTGDPGAAGLLGTGINPASLKAPWDAGVMDSDMGRCVMERQLGRHLDSCRCVPFSQVLSLQTPTLTPPQPTTGSPGPLSLVHEALLPGGDLGLEPCSSLGCSPQPLLSQSLRPSQGASTRTVRGPRTHRPRRGEPPCKLNLRPGEHLPRRPCEPRSAVTHSLWVRSELPPWPGSQDPFLSSDHTGLLTPTPGPP